MVIILIVALVILIIVAISISNSNTAGSDQREQVHSHPDGNWREDNGPGSFTIYEKKVQLLSQKHMMAAIGTSMATDAVHLMI